MIILTSNKTEVVIKKQGAEVISVKHDFEEYIWQGNKKYWGRQAPVLFPIVGKLKDDKYQFDNQEYHMTQHGFARDCEFKVVKYNDTSVTLELESNQETLKVYPFTFKLEITYELFNNELEVKYKVTNLDDKTMYYQIGAHPGFNLYPEKQYTINLDQNIKDANFYDLKGPYVNEKMPLEKTSFEFNQETFKDGALIIEPKDAVKKVVIKEGDFEYITVEYDDFELLGIWSPENTDAPFVCIEPWNGVADFAARINNDFKQKNYMHQLEVNKTTEIKYKMTFK